MKPRGALNANSVRVLAAVLGGARTWSEVMAATGLSRNGVADILHRLRAEGLVGFADGGTAARRAGTLHPTCRVVR